MQYSTNYEMNKPERADQFNLDHWNRNTDIIDNQLKSNSNDILSESDRATGAESALRNLSDSDFKTALLNFCHPVGSYYWSSESTDPSALFGGTWTQIKDRFILAKGDSDSVGATGGAKTVKLSESNLPSHKHYFTAEGGISGGSYSFSGTTDTVNVSGGNHRHSIPHGVASNDPFWDAPSPRSSRSTGNVDGGYIKIWLLTGNNYYTNYSDLSMSGSFTPKGSVSVSSNPSFSGTRKETEAKGSGTAVDKMPPYLVAYCWRRTA